MSKVKFFFPDSHDFVDPTFDFEKETRNEHRVIQRDDKYAHELFSKPVYDGILVSKAVVDNVSSAKVYIDFLGYLNPIKQWGIAVLLVTLKNTSHYIP